MIHSRLGVALVVLTSLCVCSLRGKRSVAGLYQPIGTAMPARIADWAGTDEPLSDRQYRLLETRDVLMRDYRRGKESVFACVVVAAGDRKVAHPPEICYQGQGWEVVELESVEVDWNSVAKVQRMVVSFRGREQLVMSWYRVGNYDTHSVWMQHLVGLASEFSAGASRCGLVRLSTPIRSGDRKGAAERLDAFAAQFIPLLDAAWPQRRGADLEEAQGDARTR